MIDQVHQLDSSLAVLLFSKDALEVNLAIFSTGNMEIFIIRLSE